MSCFFLLPGEMGLSKTQPQRTRRGIAATKEVHGSEFHVHGFLTLNLKLSTLHLVIWNFGKVFCGLFFVELFDILDFQPFSANLSRTIKNHPPQADSSSARNVSAGSHAQP